MVYITGHVNIHPYCNVLMIGNKNLNQLRPHSESRLMIPQRSVVLILLLLFDRSID